MKSSYFFALETVLKARKRILNRRRFFYILAMQKTMLSRFLWCK